MYFSLKAVSRSSKNTITDSRISDETRWVFKSHKVIANLRRFQIIAGESQRSVNRAKASALREALRPEKCRPDNDAEICRARVNADQREHELSRGAIGIGVASGGFSPAVCA
jgi:hypothetical protein